VVVIVVLQPFFVQNKQRNNDINLTMMQNAQQQKIDPLNLKMVSIAKKKTVLR
jgi:hypothetical protein